MANAYTSRLKKRLPDPGDIGWDDEWHDNERIDDVVMGALLSANRVTSGGAVTAGAGMTANYAAMEIMVAGAPYTINAGSVNLTAAQPGAELGNWVSVNSIGTVAVSTTAPSGEYVPLARVDTSDAAIIRIADLRPVSPGGLAPVGSIIPWIGGHFTSSANAGFTSVLGNSVAAVNALLNNSGWYVCDGSALNISGSLIFNAAGRYLPNLTDNRFVMGSTAAGATGGSNSSAHTHDVTHDHGVFASAGFTLTTNEMPSHRHANASGVNPLRWIVSGGSLGLNTPGANNATDELHPLVGGGAAHAHNVDVPSSTVTSQGASNTENRPAFLSCFYLIRVK